MMTVQSRDDSIPLDQISTADQTLKAEEGSQPRAHEKESPEEEATNSAVRNVDVNENENDNSDPGHETEKDLKAVASIQGDETKEGKENFGKQASWSKLKKIVTGAKKNVIQNILNPGSMTDAERSFLRMLNASSKKVGVGGPSTSSSSSSECGKIQQKISGSSIFAHVVDAAIARDRLRKELKARLSKLTSKEARFLKDLVEDEEVTREQLENADKVLRTDPLYRISTEDDEEFATEDFSKEEVKQEESDAPAPEVNRNRGKNEEKKEDGKVSDKELGRKRNPLDLSVRMGDLGLEVFFKGIENTPAAYSFNTWDRSNNNDSQTFPVLGNLDEISENDRILSPPMIDSLRKFLPSIIAEDNFWLKYSMVKDGSSILNLYDCVRQSSRTLIAIETVDGDVFGGFASSPWRNHNNFYGSCEAFLWRLKSSKNIPCSSMEEQVKMESSVEAFKWSRQNRSVQMSNRSRIVMGGGMPEDEEGKSSESRDWGLGIALDGNLLQGTTSDCATFSSPPLTNTSSKDNIFEISNMEVWSFTPCQNVEEAEQLEMGRMFVLSHFEPS